MSRASGLAMTPGNDREKTKVKASTRATKPALQSLSSTSRDRYSHSDKKTDVLTSTSSLDAPVASMKPRADIMSFIESLDEETERQEQSLAQWKRTLIQTVAPTHQALMRPTVHAKEPALSSSTSLSLASTAHSSGTATPVMPARSSSLSADLHALTGSTHADATFAKVRDKMLGLTETVQQQLKQIQSLQSQLAQSQQSLTQQQQQHTAELETQKKKYSQQLQQQLSFIDALVKDKQTLNEQIESLHSEFATVERQCQSKIDHFAANHRLELESQEKMLDKRLADRQSQWSKTETKRIKELSLKTMEKEISRVVETLRKKEEDLVKNHEKLLSSLQTKHSLDVDELKKELSMRHSIDLEERQRRFDATLAKVSEDNQHAISAAVKESEERHRLTHSISQREFDEMFVKYKTLMAKQIDELKASHSHESAKLKSLLREEFEREKIEIRNHEKMKFSEERKLLEREIQSTAEAHARDQIAHIVDRLNEDHTNLIKMNEQNHCHEQARMKRELEERKTEWKRETQQKNKSLDHLQLEYNAVNEELAQHQLRLKDRDRLLNEKSIEIETLESRVAELTSRVAQLTRQHQQELEAERQAGEQRVASEKSFCQSSIDALHSQHSESMNGWKERVSGTIAKKDAIIDTLQGEVKHLQLMLAKAQKEFQSLTEGS